VSLSPSKSDGAGPPIGEGGAASPALILGGRRAFITGLLAIVPMFAIIDRHLLSVILAPVQRELGVSDTAMGVLSGLAFAVFYATAAIPVARLADRGNRRNLLVIAFAIWSGATALCGLAGSYVHLLLARIGVAAGESAANPAIMSMIGDLYPSNRRGGAVGLMFAATAIGMFAGSYLGGLINDLYGWRAAFILLGAPGVFLALLIWFLVPEPMRGAYDRGARDTTSTMRTSELLRHLFRIRTFTPLLIGECVSQMAFYSFLTWTPTMLIRVQGFSTTQAGLLFGVSMGVGGLLGSGLSGLAGDRLARNGVRWYLYLAGASCLVGAPLVVMLLNVKSHWAMATALTGFAIICGGVVSTALTAGLAIVEARARAFMTAILYFCMNLVGAGLGPPIVGYISDVIRPAYGDHSLQIALYAVAIMLIVPAVSFFIAGRRIEADALRVGATVE